VDEVDCVDDVVWVVEVDVAVVLLVAVLDVVRVEEVVEEVVGDVFEEVVDEVVVVEPPPLYWPMRPTIRFRNGCPLLCRLTEASQVYCCESLVVYVRSG